MSYVKKLIRLGLLHSDDPAASRSSELDELSEQDRVWIAWFAALSPRLKRTVEAWARKGIKVTPDILSDILAIDAAKSRLTAEWRSRAGRYRRTENR